MKTGKVKFFKDDKGFGFIIDEDTGNEVFVHATGLVDGTRIKTNDIVTYDEEQGKKGLMAVKVSVKF